MSQDNTKLSGQERLAMLALDGPFAPGECDVFEEGGCEGAAVFAHADGQPFALIDACCCVGGKAGALKRAQLIADVLNEALGGRVEAGSSSPHPGEERMIALRQAKRHAQGPDQIAPRPRGLAAFGLMIDRACRRAAEAIGDRLIAGSPIETQCVVCAEPNPCARHPFWDQMQERREAEPVAPADHRDDYGTGHDEFGGCR